MTSTVLVFMTLLVIKPTGALSQYKWEKLEEFKINSLYNVEIIDYHPKEKLYLGYINTAKGTQIALIDENGEFAAKEMLTGEGPNQSASAINSMAFAEDGNIWLQTAVQLLLCDRDFVIKKRIRYPSSLKMNIYGRMEVFPYFYQEGSSSDLSFITNPSGTNSYIFKKDIGNDLIEIYDIKSDKLDRIAPVADRPMIKRFDEAMRSHLYSLVYAVDRDARKLYLTTALDNDVSVYDLTSRKLVSRIKIVHDEFKILQQNSITEKDLPSHGRVSLGAKNHKIFLLDDGLVLLDFIREIPYGTYEKKKAEDPTYHHFQDPAYHRLILFKGGEQLTGELSLPLNGKLMAVLPGNRLLMQLVNPDVEEDFIRYGIYRLVESK